MSPGTPQSARVFARRLRPLRGDAGDVFRQVLPMLAWEVPGQRQGGVGHGGRLFRQPLEEAGVVLQLGGMVAALRRRAHEPGSGRVDGAALRRRPVHLREARCFGAGRTARHEGRGASARCHACSVVAVGGHRGASVSCDLPVAWTVDGRRSASALRRRAAVAVDLVLARFGATAQSKPPALHKATGASALVSHRLGVGEPVPGCRRARASVCARRRSGCRRAYAPACVRWRSESFAERALRCA